MNRHTLLLQQKHLHRLDLGRYDKAFSLVEMMVVIGIVVILLALLIPAVGRLRNAAVEVKCLSNVRLFGNATLSGIADHGGSIDAPIVDGYPDCNAFVTPYLNGQALLCPNAYTPPPGGLNYAINNNLWGDVWARVPRKINTIALPWSRVVLASESAVSSAPYFNEYPHLDSTMWGNLIISPPSNTAPYANYPAQYHGTPTHRGLNMFMLDGSAALVCPAGGGGWGPGTATYGTPSNSGYYYDYNQFY